MVFIWSRVARLSKTYGWLLPLMVAGFVFVTAWPLMAVFEPGDNPIARWDTYWWWFVVTSSTVGYGDVSPVSLGGRVVGVYVILGGIATLTTIITKLSENLDKIKGRRMFGRAEHAFTDHLVILGYTPGRTDDIVAAMTEDGARTIVLCAWEDQANEHPLSDLDDVHFVRGRLDDPAVLERASAGRASVLLVDARDDNEALAITATAGHVTASNHIVVGLRSMESQHVFGYVDRDVRCVQWHSIRMITEELQDPGISRVYNELMTGGGANTYSMVLPDSAADVSFGDLQATFGRGLDGMVLAVLFSGGRLEVSPDWSEPVPAGSRLFYVGRRRHTPEELASVLAPR